MKNFSPSFPALVLTLVGLSVCTPRAHAAKNLIDTRKACVQVVLRTGETFDGRFKLPEGWDKKPVRVRPAAGKRRKFGTEQIAALIVWEKRHPDKQYVLQRITRPYYNRKGVWKRDLSQWMILDAAGEHLTVYTGGTCYEFRRRTGVLVTLVPQYVAFDRVGVKKGAERGAFIGTPKALVEFLADDPTLCRRIEEHEIRPDDYRTIVDVYEPVS